MDAILELRHVTKAYEGFTLRDVSFTLPRGYIMGLIGPNGAGKTTIMKTVLNLVKPDAGDIRVFGLDHRRDEIAVRSRIGFVHERPRFHDALSVRAAASVIARFYPAWDDGAFTGLARDFGLPLGKRVRDLSRGMRTRFALAVAMAHRAELLLLDEATSGLDPVFRHELLDRLSGLIEGGDTSVLFSTHITTDLDRIADYVTFLNNGRLVFSATQDEIRERWVLVKGAPELLTDRTRHLFAGTVVNEFSFTGLTGDLGRVRDRLSGATLVVEKATLDDVLFFTGRSGYEGMRLHDNGP
jgi:ABC-2 type transport system ATP-binding protein